MNTAVRPFRIAFGDDVLDDLMSRVRKTRWAGSVPAAVTSLKTVVVRSFVLFLRDRRRQRSEGTPFLATVRCSPGRPIGGDTAYATFNVENRLPPDPTWDGGVAKRPKMPKARP